MEPLSGTLAIVSFLALAAWIGEVVTLNVVVVPALGRMEDGNQKWFLARMFPLFFRLATVLSLCAVGFGAASVALAPGEIPNGVTTGGCILILLTAFHLLIESRLRPLARTLPEEEGDELLRFFVKFLRIVPRVGLVVVVSAFVILVVSVGG